MPSSDLIAGRYRIISQLGEGGMGVAYRAWDNEHDVPVVVKMPKADKASDSDFIERFKREIKAMAGLTHPHIVPIVGYGQDIDGRPYVAMRFLPGGSLSDRRRRGPDKQTLPSHPSLLHQWLPSISDALDVVHRAGLVHRDVKPDNIFFDARWNAFLGDFGVAKVIEAGGAVEKDATMTATGMAVGTHAYMSPEVFSNRPVAASDQYSLAITVYELLAGTRPFTGESSHIIAEHLTMPVPPLKDRQPQLPSNLCEAVRRALSKKPEERFETCGDFAAAVLKRVPVPSVKDGVTRVICPACHAMLDLDEKVAGKSGKCRKCGAPVTVSTDLEAVWLHSENPEKPIRTNGRASETTGTFHAPRPPRLYEARENATHSTAAELGDSMQVIQGNPVSTSGMSSIFGDSTERSVLGQLAYARRSAITAAPPPRVVVPYKQRGSWWEPEWFSVESAWWPVLLFYWCVTRLLGLYLCFIAFAFAVFALIDGCSRYEDRMRREITKPVVAKATKREFATVEARQTEDKTTPLGITSPSGPSPPQERDLSVKEEEAAPKPEPGSAAAIIDGLLAESLKALRSNDYDTFKKCLAAASQEANGDAAVSRRLESWRLLAHYHKGFVRYCEEALADVRAGDEYFVAGLKVIILGIDDRVFSYRFGNNDSSTRTVPWERDNIPRGIMLAIVTDWFDGNPANDLYLGASHLVGYQYHSDPDLARANEHWQNAQEGGADASLLIPLLRDPVITNRDDD
jgi:serine/threonine protein kinase